ncbi:MAG TPA: hypothetical protein PLE74_00985 [Candidatus Cloacimonadota bacterium]|nr:hypothetical protein [Candidatus Cloacimonadota bacterium]
MAEFIHKAHVYDPKKHIINPSDWYISEKLDGRYFIWDGGVTVGMPAKNVTWANTKKDKREMISTGLWSSLGKVITAPPFIIEQLMQHPYLLEGELYLGRGQFQECMSITKRLDYTEQDIKNWERINLMVFGAPMVRYFLEPRVISKTDVIIPVQAESYWRDLGIKELCQSSTFGATYERLSGINWNGNICLVDYTNLSTTNINQALKEVCDKGGEGLMLRASYDVWMAKRCNTILKIKPWKDDEGYVTGYIAGKEGKTGKMLGMIGALVIGWHGKSFELSGMTDAERTFHPNEDMIPGYKCVGISPHFPLGKKITFRYRELTVDGVPKEARYHRPYMEEE